jgi:hypothetical protein
MTILQVVLGGAEGFAMQRKKVGENRGGYGKSRG